MKIALILANLLFVLCYGEPAEANTYIDSDGVLRWQGAGEEVCIFGTNYSTPFAYRDWRAPIEADDVGGGRGGAGLH